MKKLLLGLLVLCFAQLSSAQGVFQKYGPVAGVQYNPGNTYQDTAATAAQIASPFGCSGSQGLSGTGGCLTPSGGTVTSFSVTSVPSWLTSSVATPTTTPALTIGVASGQTANQFLATPNGSTGTVGLRAIAGADLPPINLGSTANGGVLNTSILLGTNGGTSNGFFSVTGPATSLKTFTFPNASATVLTTNAAVTVAQGGTGLATLTAHGVLLGEGTSNIGNVAAMAADTLLQGQGVTADPAAVSINNCGSSTTALSYSTSTHTFGCQTISVGGTPGGSNTQLQYNNSGVFGGASNFTYTSGTGDVAITAPTSGVALTVNSLNNSRPITAIGGATTGQSFGILINAGTNSSDDAIRVQNEAASLDFFRAFGDGHGTLGPSGSLGLSWNTAGAVAIAAPTSGVALSASGAANSAAISVSGSGTTGQSKGIFINAGTNSSDWGLRVQNQAGSANYFGVNGDGSIFAGINGSSTFNIAATGATSIGAPSSGNNALSVTGIANGWGVQVNGPTTAGQSKGVQITAGTNSTDFILALQNAAASVNEEIFYGDGGVIFGSPTGGNKGAGTLNVSGNLYVNNIPVLTAAGSSTKLAGGVMTSSGGNTCVVNQNNGGISSCSEGAAGNINVTFTASYFGTSATCVADSVNTQNLNAATQGTFSGAGNLNVTIRNSSNTLTDGSFTLICIGS